MGSISFPKVITINKSVFYLKIDLAPLIDLFICIPVSVYVCVVCNLLVGTHSLWSPKLYNTLVSLF